MSQRFESRPILVRRSATATLHGTVVLEWRAQVSHGLHLFCIIAASVVARNVANQQVLDSVGPQLLGTLYITVALLAGILLAGVGWLSQGADARRVALLAHLSVALTMVLAWALPAWPELAFAKYVAMELAAAVLLLVFGLLLGSRFAPREARKIAARVGAGGILGGLVGGSILSVGATLVGSRWLLLAAAILTLAPLVWLLGMERPKAMAFLKPQQKELPEVPSLAPYGRWVAISTVFMVATTTLIDYQFRFTAKNWYGADELTAFFGFVILLAGLVTILFQLTLLDPMLDRLGLFATATIMPAALVISGALLGLIPTLATLVLLKMVDSGANMSVQQATGGLLLAPLGTRARSVWQSRIDGLAKRGGQALTGLFLLAFPWTPGRVLPVTLALCGVWIFAIAITRSRYVALLTDMLRGRRPDEPEVRAYDGDTVRFLVNELSAQPTQPRARVILELLREAEHRVPTQILKALDTQGPEGPGALVVIDHLTELGDTRPLVEYAAHDSLEVASRALLALAALDQTVSQRVARASLLARDRPEPMRALAAGLLAGSDEAALHVAEGFARSPEADVRLALAEGAAAAEPGVRAGLAALLAVLARDEVPRVAKQALLALGRHPSIEGTEVALQALAVRQTRNAAARALVALGPPAVDRLVRELDDKLDEPRVAAAVAWVLGKVGAASGLPGLVRALRAGHAEVRLAVAIALNSMHRRRPQMQLPQDDIEPRYLAEVAEYARFREAARLELGTSPAARVFRGLVKQRAQASLECLFRLLALRYPEEAVRGALTAVSSGDRRQRQIGLELLDTVVEAPVRQALLQIEGEVQPRRKTREPQQIVLELAGERDPFLAALSRHVLEVLGGKVRTDGKEASKKMSTSLIEDILELQSVNLFSLSSAEDLAELASLLTERAVKKGALLFREGDPGDNLYLIKSGSVALSRRGQAVELIGPGEACGVLAILDQRPRELTAVAAQDCELRVLAGEDLLQLLTDRPLFMHSLFRALTGALRGQLERAALGKKTEVA